MTSYTEPLGRTIVATPTSIYTEINRRYWPHPLMFRTDVILHKAKQGTLSPIDTQPPTSHTLPVTHPSTRHTLPQLHTLPLSHTLPYHIPSYSHILPTHTCSSSILSAFSSMCAASRNSCCCSCCLVGDGSRRAASPFTSTSCESCEGE